jgi:hypothetical protein
LISATIGWALRRKPIDIGTAHEFGKKLFCSFFHQKTSFSNREAILLPDFTEPLEPEYKQKTDQRQNCSCKKRQALQTGAQIAIFWLNDGQRNSRLRQRVVAGELLCQQPICSDLWSEEIGISPLSRFRLAARDLF